MKREKEWLPHLQGAVPIEVYGFSTTMYSIALEAWRRGLTVSFINKHQTKAQTEFIISNKKKRYRFSGSRSNIITKETINLCANKQKTKEILKEYDVPVVDGKLFDKRVADEEIVKFVNHFKYPVVVKPYNGNGGDGVVVNIKDEQKLRSALTVVRKQLNHHTILIERYVPSLDYQVYIIGNQVVAAFERIPAYVVGDGERTIQSLINQKNNYRRRNPGLSHYLIKSNNSLTTEILEEQGHTLGSVPSQGELVDLRIRSNIALGGETVDITDQLPKNIKKMAIRASKAMPDLPICAVEIIVDKETGKGHVLEIKTQPTISGHLFPVKGKARDVAKNIIDFYFPETEAKTRDTKHYFDFNQVFKMFQANYFSEYTLPRAPQENCITKRFVIKGVVNRKNFIDLIQPQLLSKGMNGFFRYRRNGKLVLVVVGTEKAMKETQSLIDSVDDLKQENFSIEERKWDKPVKIGFEVQRLNNDRKVQNEKLQRKNTNGVQQNPLEKILEAIKNINITF